MNSREKCVAGLSARHVLHMNERISFTVVSFYLAHFNEFYVVQECSPMS